LEGPFNLAQELDPTWKIEDIKFAVEREALQLANMLVGDGHATWKSDFDPNGVAQALKEWQSDKNRARIQKMFGNHSFLT
jgi:hypothetical protein